MVDSVFGCGDPGDGRGGDGGKCVVVAGCFLRTLTSTQGRVGSDWTPSLGGGCLIWSG